MSERLVREKSREMIAEIQHLENLAHAQGFIKTAVALNQAKNTIGWETVDMLGRIADAPQPNDAT